MRFASSVCSFSGSLSRPYGSPVWQPKWRISKIRQLTAETQEGRITNSLQESRSATLATLQKRPANFARREQSLQEIESDLQRIEAQVELALENASLSGKVETISTDMDLVSTLLDESVYGASTSSIAAVEERLHSGTTARAEPTSETGQQ
jgi:hypothetical protein